MKMINTKNSPEAIGPYEQGYIVNGFLFTSGQIPIDPTTNELVEQDITVQSHQVMKNLRGILEAANLSFNQVIKTTCFVSDMDNFAAFNAVYAEYFTEHLPARSCVEVARLPKDVLVEVELIANAKIG